jgi:hypothetical protein
MIFPSPGVGRSVLRLGGWNSSDISFTAPVDAPGTGGFKKGNRKSADSISACPEKFLADQKTRTVCPRSFLESVVMPTQGGNWGEILKILASYVGSHKPCEGFCNGLTSHQPAINDPTGDW